jgi:hypothetical protein
VFSSGHTYREFGHFLNHGGAMSKDDFSESQSAALRLRCIRVLIHVDEESLRIVDSVLGRLVPETSKPKAKRSASAAGAATTAAGAEPIGGAK